MENNELQTSGTYAPLGKDNIHLLSRGDLG